MDRWMDGMMHFKNALHSSCHSKIDNLKKNEFPLQRLFKFKCKMKNGKKNYIVLIRPTANGRHFFFIFLFLLF